jgi:hypothetical protein
MSAISRTSGVAGAGAPNRTYIAMRGYVNDFFSYTTSINNDFLTTGTLAPVVGATSGNCLTGDLLRETGKRLFPGANPGVNTLMVSVFNFRTGLKGFIDPNSLAFTPQNTDRPYYIDSAGYNPNSSVASGRRNDQGPPVITQGDLIAKGDLEVSGTADISGNTLIHGQLTTKGFTTVETQLQVFNDTYLGNNTVISGRMYYSNQNSVLEQDGNDTLTLQFGSYSAFRININSSDNFTLNASGDNTVNYMQPVYVIFNNPNNYTPTITLGDNIRELYSSGPVSLTLTGTISVTMSFISFGGKLLEMSRMNVSNS